VAKTCADLPAKHATFFSLKGFRALATLGWQPFLKNPSAFPIGAPKNCALHKFAPLRSQRTHIVPLATRITDIFQSYSFGTDFAAQHPTRAIRTPPGEDHSDAQADVVGLDFGMESGG
jgi:hypothetical protein